MAYCEIDDIRNELKMVTSAVMADARITEKINRADSLINSYIGAIYSVPVTENGMVELMSLEMTCYFVLRSLYSSDNQNLMQWQDKYKQHEARLKEIRDGKIQLFNDTTGAELGTNGQRLETSTESYRTTFDVDDETDWTQDSNRLEDIANSRSSS
jgi:phage gp36-like protein